MLNRIEQKLTSILGDDLASRTHLVVNQAPAPGSTLAAGRGQIVVSLAEISPLTQFERDRFAFNGSTSRRVLSMQAAARIDYSFRPAGAAQPDLSQARDLMLGDLSLIAHSLGRDTVANGAGFSIADPDPGFRVRSFTLDGGTIGSDAQLLSGQLRYLAAVEIWPPGVVGQEGTILGIDTVAAPLPLQLEIANTVLRAGETGIVRVRSLPSNRLATLTPRTTQPLRLAATVLSDSPPADRGTIVGGTAGAETGFRIIAVTPPDTTITYQAPGSGISRTRIEHVAIHLATPDGHRGTLLGSAAIRLEPS